jgi:hypothetical protein
MTTICKSMLTLITESLQSASLSMVNSKGSLPPNIIGFSPLRRLQRTDHTLLISGFLTIKKNKNLPLENFMNCFYLADISDSTHHETIDSDSLKQR